MPVDENESAGNRCQLLIELHQNKGTHCNDDAGNAELFIGHLGHGVSC